MQTRPRSSRARAGHRWPALVMLCALALAAPRHALALPTARASISVAGSVTLIPLSLSGGLWQSSPVVLTTGSSAVRIDRLWLDPDPGMSYAISAQNLTAAPLRFEFSFETDIAPVSSVDTSASLHFTRAGDGPGSAAGVSLTPVAANLLQVYGLSAAAMPLPLGVDLGGAVTLADGLQSAPPALANSSLVLAAPSVALGSRLAFDLSAADAVSIEVAINQVPEPATALLWVAGMLALACRPRHATQ